MITNIEFLKSKTAENIVTNAKSVNINFWYINRVRLDKIYFLTLLFMHIFRFGTLQQDYDFEKLFKNYEKRTSCKEDFRH